MNEIYTLSKQNIKKKEREEKVIIFFRKGTEATKKARQLHSLSFHVNYYSDGRKRGEFFFKESMKRYTRHDNLFFKKLYSRHQRKNVSLL